jgi:glycolate oxidase FAD binding subunit
VSATGISLDVTRELRAICGEEHVTEDASVVGHSPLDGEHPIVVVNPGSAEEVAAVLQFANARGLSVKPEGGLTTERFIVRADMVLRTSRLTHVEHYDHADLTVGVGAGMTVAQLNAMVGADRLLFACDPPQPERATVGGVLATASHGPLRHGYGGLRDFCIGIRFVTGDGRRAKGGGRVVKNVAGYDLMKLLIGSYGTLAVITSASFKLFPAPRKTRTFLTEFGTPAEALRFRDLVLRSPLAPMCLELVSPGARKLMRPEMASDAWVICVRAAGSDAVLARYRKELGLAITRELEGEDERKMWRAIENFPHASDQGPPAEQAMPFQSRVHISVPPSDVLRVIEILETAKLRDVVSVGIVGRIGLGHLLVTWWPIKPDDTWALYAMIVVEELKASMGSGVNTKLDHGAMRPWPVSPPTLESMRAVKRALDPNDVLRGREIF